MSTKTKRALRKKRYLDNKDASQSYMKEYRKSNRNAIRESQKQYFELNKDAKKLSVQQHYEQNKNAIKLSVRQHVMSLREWNFSIELLCLIMYFPVLYFSIQSKTSHNAFICSPPTGVWGRG